MKKFCSLSSFFIFNVLMGLRAVGEELWFEKGRPGQVSCDYEGIVESVQPLTPRR